MWKPYLVLFFIFSIVVGTREVKKLGKNQSYTSFVKKSSFGKTKSGEEIFLFTCRNNNGLTLKMINLGAIVVSLDIPDRYGNFDNVNLGFDNLDEYLGGHPYFGSTIGRFGNRIARASFTLNDSIYRLAKNDGDNHLHGGNIGYDKVIWDVQEKPNNNGSSLEFTYSSFDGEEGYPGNVNVGVIYTLTNDNELKISFKATTDKPTPINLTNHNYWNLNGAGNGNILDHELIINSNQYLDVHDNLIPTGKFIDVSGTAFDFRQSTKIGSRFQEIPKIKDLPIGYDHCFVLNDFAGGKNLRFASRVTHHESGRVMEVFTTEPGIQFYTGNFLDGGALSGGFIQNAGFCLETQHFPDAPNQPDFKSTILNPGDEYSSSTVFKFSVN